MRVKNFALLTAAALACALASAAAARAQSASVFAGGLKGPTRVVLTDRGNLLVTEPGDGPNAGRLSVIDRRTPQRRTILEGLPAGPSPEGPRLRPLWARSDRRGGRGLPRQAGDDEGTNFINGLTAAVDVLPARVPPAQADDAPPLASAECRARFGLE